MNDTKQPVSEKSPEYLAATLREVAETLTDVGKTIDARLGAWAAPETPEPEPPSVEVDGMAQHWRYTRITSFSHEATGLWRVYGDCINEAGHAYPNTYNCTTATPFSIWRECRGKGVPCPEPPTIALLNFYGGPITDVASITEVRRHGNATKIICTHRAQGEWKTNAVCLVAETPAAIRALCDAAGVPCPEEEKPKTVQCSGWTWTHIRRVTVRARSNSTLDTTITGVSNSGSGKEFDLHSARTTPAQVVALCKLAGWPKPEVHMVCTFCDGTPCEIDPASVCSVDTIRLPGERSTLVTCEDGSTSCFVREPVAVVEAMRDACKEGE